MRKPTEGYKGTFVLAKPPTRKDLERHIVAGCNCYGCNTNRKRVKEMKP